MEKSSTEEETLEAEQSKRDEEGVAKKDAAMGVGAVTSPKTGTSGRKSGCWTDGSSGGRTRSCSAYSTSELPLEPNDEPDTVRRCWWPCIGARILLVGVDGTARSGRTYGAPGTRRSFFLFRRWRWFANCSTHLVSPLLTEESELYAPTSAPASRSGPSRSPTRVARPARRCRSPRTPLRGSRGLRR